MYKYSTCTNKVNLVVMISFTLGGTSNQPSLIPGPKILEKLPLEITFPL